MKLMPDHCDDESCMVNNEDNYPNLCIECTIEAMNNLKSLDPDDKIELFYLFKEFNWDEDADIDKLRKECIEEGGMTPEEYERIETEVWNTILREEEDDGV